LPQQGGTTAITGGQCSSVAPEDPALLCRLESSRHYFFERGREEDTMGHQP